MDSATEVFDIVSSKPNAMFDEGMEIIINNVLQLPLDNPIPLAIYHDGVSTWDQFTYMDECDVKEVVYKDSNGATKFLTKGEQKLLRFLIGYVLDNIDTHTPGSDLPSFYTKDGFKQYIQNRNALLEQQYGTRRKTEVDNDERGYLSPTNTLLSENVLTSTTARRDLIYIHDRSALPQQTYGTTTEAEDDNYRRTYHRLRC